MKIALFKDLSQFTLTSTLTTADILLVKKYRPSALKKKDKDGNDIFAVSYNAGKPCVASNGITFGSTSHDGGFAMVIKELPAGLGETEVTNYVADYVGEALAPINEFEKSIPEVVEAIKKERGDLIDSITVV